MLKDSNIPVLDSIRAMAAIMVCLFHFVCTTQNYIESQTILTIFNIGKHGVEMFFVVSGFVIPWSMYHTDFKLKNFPNFLLKRILRLEPPYLISILLILIVLFLRKELLGRSNDYMEISGTQIALHFGYLIPFFKDYHWLNNVYWTLAIEFQYYILIAVLFTPIFYSKGITRGIIFIILLVLQFFSKEIFVFYYFSYFIIGILLFLKLSNKLSNNAFYFWLMITVATCLVNFSFDSVICAIIPVVLILYRREIKIPVLKDLGRFSYSIYLIHPVVGAGFINYFSHIYRLTYQKIIVISGGLIITFISSWIMYMAIEQPSKKLSSSLKYK